MIKIWVNEDLYVMLVYCGVVEEYAVYSTWNSTLVGLVYFLNSDDRLHICELDSTLHKYCVNLIFYHPSKRTNYNEHRYSSTTINKTNKDIVPRTLYCIIFTTKKY